MILDYLFLPVFFFIGLITSYEDFRYGKIRNKWIIAGFVWALTVYFFFFLGNLLHFGGIAEEISFSLLGKSFLNGFTALFVACLIWRFSGWSAGDAKLFFVFSLLIPITYYQKFYLPIFPSFALLVNIFIPLLLFLLFRSCFVLFKIRGRAPEILKGFFRDKNYWLARGVLMFGFFGIILIFGFIREKLATSFLKNSAVFLQAMFFAALIIFSRFSGLFSKKTAIIKISFLIFSFSAAYGVVFAPRLTWQILSTATPWMIIFIFTLGLLGKLLDFYVQGAEKRGWGAFSMAIWIFLGGIITLIIRGSVLSAFSALIFR